MSNIPAMSPVNGSSRSPFKRIGLSEYTSQRLAELKARRAEADEDMKVISKTKSPEITRIENNDGHKSADLNSIYPQSPTKQQESELDVNEERDYEPHGDHRNDIESNLTVEFPEGDDVSNQDVAMDEQVTEEIEDNEISNHQNSMISDEAKHVCSLNSVDRDNDSNGYLLNSFEDHKSLDNDGDYVGFASLPDQVHRKAVKKGFEFTLMVVGESGLGKSTLVSCLFQDVSMYKSRVVDNSQELISKTVSIERKVFEIEEKGVRLKLTVIDTPGFNDALDNAESWRTICNYVDEQHHKFLKEETGINRRSIMDSRVHCCLVFLSPLGRGIRQTEITLMKELQSRVNLIPIISKADTLTTSEIIKLKDKILNDAIKHDIKMYELPECDDDEDEDFIKQNKDLKAAIPFAVIGSNTVIDIGGKKIRGRMYPWGIVDVDNPKHCDFSKLRQFLIGTHMQDLKDVTQEVHYENYRATHLQEEFNKTQKERKLKRCSSSAQQMSDNADDLIRQKELEIERMKSMLKDMQHKLTINQAKPSPV